MLPIIAPGLGATAVFNLAAYWSEFCLALVLLDSQARYTMPLGLFSFQSGYDTDWHLLAAASFIALVPVHRRRSSSSNATSSPASRRARSRDASKAIETGDCELDLPNHRMLATSTSSRTRTGIASGT